MEVNLSDLFDGLRDYIKTPKHSSDKFCWQIAKNILIHRSPEGEIFATIPIPPDGRMVFPIRSPFIFDCIVDHYIREASSAPNSRSVRNAIRAREAIVFLRVAGYGKRIGPAIPNPERIVIDLNNKTGEIVLIDKDGWKVEGGWPHCLVRPRHMQPIPSPAAKAIAEPGHVEILSRFRSLLNPATTRDFHRMLIWLLSAARGSGPFPVLAVDGPAASRKRTAAHLLRQTINPSFGPFAEANARDRDLFQHAQRTGWLPLISPLTSRSRRRLHQLAGRERHPTTASFRRILTIQPPCTSSGRSF